MEGKRNTSNKVIKAGIGYTIGNYFIKGLSFVTLPIFTRLLSTEDYGIYNTFFAYEAIVSILVGLALHSSLKNAKYKFENRFGEYISSIILLILCNFLLWIVVCNSIYGVVNKFIDLPQNYTNLLLIYSLGTALIYFYNNYIGLEYRYKSFVKMSAVNAFGNIVISIFLIVTVFSESRGYGRIVGSSIPVIIIGIYVLIYFFRDSKPKFNKEFWGFGLRYSLPIVPHGISQMILLQFDRIMINTMIGSSEAGIYGFSYSIYSIISITGTSIDSVLGPWFYEKMKDNDLKNIRRQSGKLAVGMLMFSILMILVTPEMVKVLGSKAYWSSIYSAVPLVAGGYFSFLYLFPAYVEYYYEKTNYIAIGTMMAAALNVVANFVCIQRFGYIAAAYTTMFTYLLYFLFHCFISKKIQGIFLYDVRRLFVCVIGMISSVFVTVFMVDHLIIRWIIALFIAIYMGYRVNREFDIKDFIRKKLKGEKNK